MRRYFGGFKASGVDADTTITALPFMCSTMVSVTTTGQFYTSHRSMATSQRLNAFSNDLDCMVEVKMRWFKLFCRRFRYRVIKTFTLAPSPIAVLAANSPCSST
jgi:hypothetical protein